MATFLSEQMQAFINAVDGGIFGKALLFILLMAVLHVILQLVNNLFKNKFITRTVGLMNAGVWYVYFTTIGWSFMAGLIVLLVIYKMFFWAIEPSFFGTAA